jgi:hypothetical protein
LLRRVAQNDAIAVGLVSSSFNLSFSSGSNSGVPPPSIGGLSAIRNSSISPCAISVADRPALPVGRRQSTDKKPRQRQYI